MLINFSDLKSIPVAAQNTQTKLGIIKDLVIDPKTGKLFCFLVQTGFFSPLLALFPPDINKLENDYLLVDAPEALVKPKEIIRANEVLKQKIKILEQSVVNRKLKKIGTVSDLTLDWESQQLNRITVTLIPWKGILEAERLIPWNKIIEITKDYVMIEEFERAKIKETVKEFIQT